MKSSDRERWMAWKGRKATEPAILHVVVERVFRTDRGDRYAVISPAVAASFRQWPWQEASRAVPLGFLHRSRADLETELALHVLADKGR